MALILPPPRGQSLPRFLATRLPFFYGWVVLGVLCCVGFARQGPAVATLSIFIEPLTREFGWSRAALSGAVSLGGVLAALSSPMIGPWLDKSGARTILCIVVFVNAALLIGLSLASSLVVFYALFCLARMNWAGPFDLGIYGAVSNWFVHRRASAISVATLAQMLGLVAMPLIAQLAIDSHGWRSAWLTIGFVPSYLLLVGRPEDLDLLPDHGMTHPDAALTVPDVQFTRSQAVRTPAFWLLMAYTMLVYPVQAGVSLHQAPFLIERGIDPTIAATVVSTFSLMSAVASILCGVLPRRLPAQIPLAAIGIFLAASTLVMLTVHTPARAFLGAALFGLGVGGVLTLLPLAWADFFGRSNYGAIRGIALSAQVSAQAVGPILSGTLRDMSGSYVRSLECFTALSVLSVVVALVLSRPR
jgi:MFS transporter, OFA family, oxalate/formate antiporter